jgi:Uma2 family endonuclease
MSTTTRRWTLADLDQFPEPVDDTRYEIIDGELFVSTQPSAEHQYTCNVVAGALWVWSEAAGAGVSLPAPGLIFADDDNVAPDVVWASTERLAGILGADGKLHAAPELVVEVLSPGKPNERRDRQSKLGLYSQQDVAEYWIVDSPARAVDVYRRDSPAAPLRRVATLELSDALASPLLPGFNLQVARLFFPALPGRDVIQPPE